MTYLVQIDDLVRPANEIEIAKFEQIKNETAAHVAALEAAAAAKASARAKLAALGLTDAEIAAFLGA